MIKIFYVSSSFFVCHIRVFGVFYICLFSIFNSNEVDKLKAASYFAFYLHNWTTNTHLTVLLPIGLPLKYYVGLKTPTVFRNALILIFIHQFSKVCGILCTCLKGTPESPYFILSTKKLSNGIYFFSI